jgi:hypothetical protein
LWISRKALSKSMPLSRARCAAMRETWSEISPTLASRADSRHDSQGFEILQDI